MTAEASTQHQRPLQIYLVAVIKATEISATQCLGHNINAEPMVFQRDNSQANTINSYAVAYLHSFKHIVGFEGQALPACFYHCANLFNYTCEHPLHLKTASPAVIISPRIR